MEILIVTGEASGDEHGAKVVRQIKAENPDINFFGMGGENLRSSGVEIIVDSKIVAGVMGFTEVFSKLFSLLKARKKLINEIKRRKPKLAILIDFPDFNFSLFKTLKTQNVKVIYYAAPKVWAWRKSRVKTIKKYVDKVLSIIPFEKEFYQKAGVDVTYVGHPILEHQDRVLDKQTLMANLNLDSQKKLLALLPGSRKAEIDLLLPDMLAAAEIVKSKYKDIHSKNIQVAIPVASSLDYDSLKSRVPTDIKLLKGNATELLNCADAAIIASGTVLLDASLAKVPFLVLYRLKPLTYFIAKNFVTGVKYFSLPNLISGKEVVKEFLQDQVEPEIIAKEVIKFLEDTNYRRDLISNLESVNSQLSIGERTSSKVAKEVLLAANS